MIDLKAIGEIPDTCTTLIGVGDDDDLVATVDELGR